MRMSSHPAGATAPATFSAPSGLLGWLAARWQIMQARRRQNRNAAFLADLPLDIRKDIGWPVGSAPDARRPG